MQILQMLPIWGKPIPLIQGLQFMQCEFRSQTYPRAQQCFWVISRSLFVDSKRYLSDGKALRGISTIKSYCSRKAPQHMLLFFFFQFGAQQYPLAIIEQSTPGTPLKGLIVSHGEKYHEWRFTLFKNGQTDRSAYYYNGSLSMAPASFEPLVTWLAGKYHHRCRGFPSWP